MDGKLPGFVHDIYPGELTWWSNVFDIFYTPGKLDKLSKSTKAGLVLHESKSGFYYFIHNVVALTFV